MRDLTGPEQVRELLTVLREGLWFAIRRFPLVAVLAAPVELILAIAADASADSSDVAVFLTGFPLVAVLTPTAKAAVIVAAAEVEARGDIGALRAALAAVLRRLPVLLIASIGWLVAVLLGVVALVIPGVIILFGGQCLMGALVIENRSVRDAARRSWQLVKPAFLTVVLVFIVAQIVAGVIAGLVLAIVGDDVIGSMISGFVAAPFVHGPLAVLFLRRAAGLGLDEVSDEPAHGGAALG